MTDNFVNHVLKTGVAALGQAIGWNSVQTTTVDVLSDLWRRQLLQIAKLSTNYAIHYGRTEVSLDDVALAFDNLNVSTREIEEYVVNFDPVLLPYRVPKFPIPKENSLNILRPGSDEVVTRPDHVHEYLPTWYPQTSEDIKRAQELTAKSASDTEGEAKVDSPAKPGSISPSKSRPSTVDRVSATSEESNKSSEDKSASLNGTKRDEPVIGAQGASESPNSTPPQASISPSKSGKRLESPYENPALKRVRMMLEEEGHAIRHITSAMMTTSGFLTSSVEGRLPDTRVPSNIDFFEPAPIEKKKKIPTMKRIIEGIKKLDKENVKGGDEEEVGEYQDNLFSNPDRIQKQVRVPKPKDVEEIESRERLKATRAFKALEKSYREQQQKPAKRKETKTGKRRRKDREEESESEESIDEDFSDLDRTPEEINLEEEEQIPKKKKAKIPKLTIPKEKKDRKSKARVEEIMYDEEESITSIPSPATEESFSKKRRGRPKRLEFSDMPASLFSEQAIPDDDYTKVRRRSKRNSVDTNEMNMLVPEVSMSVGKQSRLPQPPPLTLGRIPMQPGLIPATFNAQSLMQQQNQFSITPSISITPATPDISLTPLTPQDLARPSSSLGLSSNIGSSITITRISNMADKASAQSPPASSLTSPLSISITKESGPKNVSPYQKECNTGITITPISMKHSIPDFSLTEGEMERERQRSGSAKPDEDFRTKEERRKDRERRKELKKERKKEKKLREKELGKVEKIKLSSDGTSGSFSVERKEKKDKKKKNRDSVSSTGEGLVPKLTLKLHSNTSTPVDSPRGMDRETPPPVRKITIKSMEESMRRRTPSPELARLTSLATRPPKMPKIPKLQPAPMALQLADSVSFPPPGTSSGAKKGKKNPKAKGKASQSGLVTETVGYCTDQDGNKIWICPSCGMADDGSPMIGCDTCDEWYHFICVGIEEAPDDSEPWFCGKCTARRNRTIDQKRKVLKL